MARLSKIKIVKRESALKQQTELFKDDILSGIEARFQEVTGMRDEKFSTDRDKSQEFAEVFTPLKIVKEMIDTVKDLSVCGKNLDLCAGHGQFTLGMLRKFVGGDSSFDVGKYLRENHFFSELQLESCYKLLYIFGCDINLAIGDALQLEKLPKGWRGVWLYVEARGVGEWFPITSGVRCFQMGTVEGIEKEFERLDKSLTQQVSKEYGMEIKHIVATNEGRQLLMKIAREATNGVEVNLQNVATPEEIVKEMVRCVPDLKELKKILVLFNIEFIEVLVKTYGVRKSRIVFGSDSQMEGEVARDVYGVKNVISIGKSLPEMKLALEGGAGEYDVVFSNPPYQVMDGGFGASAKPVYHEIVMYAMDILKPRYLCMITPSRWMAGGKGLDDYRARMLKDKRIRMITDFLGEKDVFETVMIKGGVSYFLWDRDYNGFCEFNGVLRDIGEFDVLVRDNTSVQILKKVLAKHDGAFCNEKVLSRKPFGLATNFKGWVPEGTPGTVKCYSVNRQIKWVLAESVMDIHGVLGKYKVCIAEARSQGITDSEGNGEPSLVTGYTFQIPKGEACTETYIVVGAFNTKKEADNYERYLQTKFYRICLRLRLISQHINKEKFTWVPDLGDYSHAWTDEELYAHFELTKHEIEHIEKTIKSL